MSIHRIIPIIERILTRNSRDALPDDIRNALAKRTIIIPATASEIALTTPSENDGIGSSHTELSVNFNA
jgi:hypothetical protein